MELAIAAHRHRRLQRMQLRQLMRTRVRECHGLCGRVACTCMRHTHTHTHHIRQFGRAQCESVGCISVVRFALSNAPSADSVDCSGKHNEIWRLPCARLTAWQVHPSSSANPVPRLGCIVGAGHQPPPSHSIANMVCWWIFRCRARWVLWALHH